MTKTAWVFPGQGSQAVGMGVDFLENPVAKTKFELAENIFRLVYSRYLSWR